MAMIDDHTQEISAEVPKMIDGVELTPKAVQPPTPEVGATVEGERLLRKQTRRRTLRIFGHYGFGEDVAGHI
ncbi:MAG: hypothetical protein R2705_05895 [Ilumatobacteraceae bacterium]